MKLLQNVGGSRKLVKDSKYNVEVLRAFGHDEPMTYEYQ
jgi:DNA-dependent RNA polymerase auxiliary subunit epsilon